MNDNVPTTSAPAPDAPIMDGGLAFHVPGTDALSVPDPAPLPNAGNNVPDSAKEGATTRNGKRIGRPPGVKDGQGRGRERDRRRAARTKQDADASANAAPAEGAPIREAASAGAADDLFAQAANIRKDFGPEAAPPPAAPPSPASALVSGYMLLIISDALFPNVIVFGLKRFTGREDVRASDLRMDAEERKMLEPVANAAAAYLLGSLNPVLLYLITIGGIYALKIPADPKPEESAARMIARKDARKRARTLKDIAE